MINPSLKLRSHNPYRLDRSNQFSYGGSCGVWLLREEGDLTEDTLCLQCGLGFGGCSEGSSNSFLDRKESDWSAAS